MPDMTSAQVVLSRSQLDTLQKHLDAGAQPAALARWLSRITVIGRLSVSQIAGAAEDLKNGYREHLYAAADRAAQRKDS